MFAINRFNDSLFDSLDFLDRLPSKNITRENYWFEDTVDSYILTVELPGYSKEHLEVELDGGKLTVSAKRETTKIKSSYKQNYLLPKDADTGKIEAELKDGLLTVSIGKNEKSKPKQITVK